MILNDSYANTAFIWAMVTMLLSLVLGGLSPLSNLNAVLAISLALAWLTSWHEDYRIAIAALVGMYLFHSVTATDFLSSLLPSLALLALLFFGRQNLSLHHEATPFIFAFAWLGMRSLLVQVVEANSPEVQTLQFNFLQLFGVSMCVALFHIAITKATKPLISVQR